MGKFSEFDVHEKQEFDLQNLEDISNSYNEYIFTHQFWPWIVVCLVSALILSCILLMISRQSASKKKQINTSETFESYKQGLFLILLN